MDANTYEFIDKLFKSCKPNAYGYKRQHPWRGKEKKVEIVVNNYIRVALNYWKETIITLFECPGIQLCGNIESRNWHFLRNKK